MHFDISEERLLNKFMNSTFSLNQLAEKANIMSKRSLNPIQKGTFSVSRPNLTNDCPNQEKVDFEYKPLEPLKNQKELGKFDISEVKHKVQVSR